MVRPGPGLARLGPRPDGLHLVRGHVLELPRPIREEGHGIGPGHGPAVTHRRRVLQPGVSAVADAELVVLVHQAGLHACPCVALDQRNEALVADDRRARLAVGDEVHVRVRPGPQPHAGAVQGGLREAVHGARPELRAVHDGHDEPGPDALL